MNKIEFVRQLRATAATMEPLTKSASSGAMTWNGQQYVKGVAGQPDPYALSWWSMLNAVAALLEAQDSQISELQRGYLEKTLFGGMGSLNDLYFDPKALGVRAESVNVSLDIERHNLYEIFFGNRNKGAESHAT